MYLTTNEKELSILGVKFENDKDFKSVKHAVASGMFEGFEPSASDIKLIRDVKYGDLTRSQVISVLRKRD